MKKKLITIEREENTESFRVDKLVLRLFVTGASPNSSRAISNLRNICESNIPGGYTLEIIDVYKSIDIARDEGLVALPLLIKKYPLPERRMIGDMSDIGKVLSGLGITL